MISRSRIRPASYGYALAAVVAAIAFRIAFEATFGRSLPYLWFILAIGFTAWTHGVGPALFATVLSTAIADVWFAIAAQNGAIDPRSAPGLLAGFAVLSIAVAYTLDLVHRAQSMQREAAAQVASHDRSLREAELAQSQLAAIVASSDDAIVGKDLAGCITSWNRGAERLFGYSADEIVGGSITRIIPSDRLAEEQSVMARVRHGERVDSFDTVRIRKDGFPIEVSVAVSPIKDGSGGIVGASKIARDISERSRIARLREELLTRERTALEDATRARDRLGFLAEVSAVLTASLDYQETLEHAVHIALPRLGDYCIVLLLDDQHRSRLVATGHVVRDKEKLLRDLVGRIIDAPASAGVPTFADTVIKTGKTLVVPHETLSATVQRLNVADRELLALGMALRPHAYVGAPLNVRGRTVGVMAFGTTAQESQRDYTDVDVTLIEEFARRVSVAVENARLFRQAEELNRLKDEFLATLSHELRTPLAAVLGWARMLAGGQLDSDKATHAVQAIERNAEAQAKIVDDILDVARGMAGNLHLEMQRLDLSKVAHQGVDAIAPAAAAKKIRINVRALEPIMVTGDPGRLQQVIWNLVSNAVKFTPRGGNITVEVVRRQEHGVIEVADSGVGIPASFLPYVFDKFRQGDGSFTREHGGLGLGLAIARHLVELHGGSICARSEGEGAGASFIVSLPLAPD